MMLLDLVARNLKAEEASSFEFVDDDNMEFVDGPFRLKLSAVDDALLAMVIDEGNEISDRATFSSECSPAAVLAYCRVAMGWKE
jgi:uncharacterized protein (UPF0262 family)